MEITTYSEFANAPGILGVIPTPPPDVEELVSTFVDKCRHIDIREEVAGDPDAWYDTKQYFENTINKIADKMGMSSNGVLSVIYRAKDKLARNMFIINHLNILSDDEIADILNSGIKNINQLNCNDFFETGVE